MNVLRFAQRLTLAFAMRKRLPQSADFGIKSAEIVNRPVDKSSMPISRLPCRFSSAWHDDKPPP
jgi:hypothetical protein